MVLFFTHIPFVVNHTINTTPPERLQQYSDVSNFTQNLNDIFLIGPNLKMAVAIPK